MNWNNKLTELLKIKYPIVQAPMLGVSTPEMVAAISNQGGLGSLPAGLFSPDKTLELIQKTKSLTGNPFAVNVFAHDLPEIDLALTDDFQEKLTTIGNKLGFQYKSVALSALRNYSYREQLDVIISEKVPVVSFTFGVLDETSVNKLQANGIILIGTATSVREAIYLEEIGIDIIVAQGIEAGGHRGTFLFDEPLPQVGTFSLVPQVVDRVTRPVLAAGGIMDGRGIKAAMILGATGVQMGSAFICSEESLAIPVYKKALQESEDTDTVLTRAFSGRWARGIRNDFHDEVTRLGIDYPQYPLLNTLTVPIRTAAQKEGNKELITLWAGQSANMAKLKSSEFIFKELVQETENLS